MIHISNCSENIIIDLYKSLSIQSQDTIIEQLEDFMQEEQYKREADIRKKLFEQFTTILSTSKRNDVLNKLIDIHNDNIVKACDTNDYVCN